jgi:hypothetical protein
MTLDFPRRVCVLTHDGMPVKFINLLPEFCRFLLRFFFAQTIRRIDADGSRLLFAFGFYLVECSGIACANPVHDLLL